MPLFATVAGGQLPSEPCRSLDLIQQRQCPAATPPTSPSYSYSRAPTAPAKHSTHAAVSVRPRHRPAQRLLRGHEDVPTACVRRRRYLRRTSRSPSRPSRCPSSPTRCPRRPARRSSTPAPARPSHSRRSCPGPARSLPRYAPVSASPRATSPCARPCSLRAPPEKSGGG